MNKVIILLSFFLLTGQTFSQTPSSPSPTKEYYLQKSKSQKRTGWILLTAGTLMAVGGGIGFGNTWDLYSSNSSADIYGFIMVGGIAVDLASIPFFISSAKNARKAATLSISSNQIFLPHQNNIFPFPQRVVALKIQF